MNKPTSLAYVVGLVAVTLVACEKPQPANNGGPSVQFEQPSAKAPSIDAKDIQAPHIDNGPSVSLRDQKSPDAGANQK